MPSSLDSYRKYIPLTQLASPSVELITVNAVEVLSADGFPLLKLKAKVRYLNKELSVTIAQPLPILSDENMIYDEDRLGGKGLQKCIKFIAEKLSPRIVGLKCEQQEDIDRELEKAYAENNNLGLYAVNSLSFLPLLLRSHLLSNPLYSIVAQ
jgi:enolase